MATRAQYENDLLRNVGAFISVTKLISYSQMSRDWWQRLLAGVDTVGTSTGKRYFYKDVAERLAKCK